ANSFVRICFSHYFTTTVASRCNDCANIGWIVNSLQNIIYCKNSQPFDTNFFHMRNKSSILQRVEPTTISIWGKRKAVFIFHEKFSIEIYGWRHILLKEANKVFIIAKILFFFKEMNGIFMIFVTCHNV